MILAKGLSEEQRSKIREKNDPSKCVLCGASMTTTTTEGNNNCPSSKYGAHMYIRI